MSATNHTTNYELPIFVGTDKPAWLVDWNGAMTAIDTAIHTAEGKADQAGTDIGGIESSISTINSTLTSINSAVSQLRIDTNANTGSINTITSLIGNGEPTTTDKTIIGAINEINAEVYDLDITAHKGAFSISSNAGTIQQDSVVNYLLNADKSIGKVYGGVRVDSVTVGSGWTSIAKLTSSDMPTIASAYNIVFGYSTVNTGSGTGVWLSRLHFNTDGTIDIQVQTSSSATVQNVFVSLPACIYFLEEMGD